MPQPHDIWTVYGTAMRGGRPDFKERITAEYTTEEDGWRQAISIRLESSECHLVLVHTTYREGIGVFRHKWRPVKTVIWRCGMGRAWFE